MPKPETRLYDNVGQDLVEQFQEALDTKGFSVTRIRASYRDPDGTFHDKLIDTYRALAGEQRQFYIHLFQEVDGTNIDNDGMKVLLFSSGVDIIEGDMIRFNTWLWRVSRAYDSFDVNDQNTCWTIQCVRERKA